MRLKSVYGASKLIHVAVVSGLLMVALPVSSAFAAPADDVAVDQAEAQAHEAWRESMRHFAQPAEGCYQAAYPSINWQKVTCAAPPSYRSARPKIVNDHLQTAGGGKDYSIQASSGHLISEVVGSFPTVKSVTSESDPDGANHYTLQLNTNIYKNAAACNGYSSCYSWQQYILGSPAYTATDNGKQSEAFIQDWLLNYGNDPQGKGNVCPSGWIDTGPTQAVENGQGDDCYRNSSATVVASAAIPAKDLASLKVSGTAKASGTDAVTVTYGTKAYSASLSDSQTAIAHGWTQAEFNVVGDGGGSEAKFNKGALITVHVAMDDGSTTKPTCVGPTNGGTTGETNNLTLGKCTASAGSSSTSPSIEFTESD